MEKREESRNFDIFLCFLGGRNVLRIEEKCPNSSQKPNFSVLVQSGVLRAIYSPWYAFWVTAHLQGPPGGPDGQPGALAWCHCDIGKFVILHFLVPTLGAHLEVFLYSNWKPWMFSFQNTKEIKIPMVGSKVMTSRSMLMRFSRFSQYLNRFNSNFDSWIVVGMRIWLSSQWHWFQLVLTAGTKLGFLGPTES